MPGRGETHLHRLWLPCVCRLSPLQSINTVGVKAEQGLTHMVTWSVFVIMYLRRREQQAGELVLHYSCISWNVPRQHGNPEIHGLLQQRGETLKISSFQLDLCHYNEEMICTRKRDFD